MSNDKAGLILHQLAHGSGDILFGAGIHVGGGLIKNKHLCVAENGPGYGQELLLSL